MIRLIYHTVTTSPDPTKQSPFEAAIQGMASSKTLRIACPYLSRNRVEWILQDYSDWYLLTDIGALFGELGREDRQWFIQLFRRNAERMRHNKNLHAKVVIADDQALVGSANLTEMGFGKRAEMAVLLSDQPTVDGLRTWFEKIFTLCQPLEPKDFDVLEKFSERLPATAPKDREQGSISLDLGPKCKAHLSVTESELDVSATSGSRKRETRPTSKHVEVYGCSRPCLIKFRTAAGESKTLTNVKRIRGAVLLALQRGGDCTTKKELQQRIRDHVDPLFPVRGGDADDKINDACRFLESNGLMSYKPRLHRKLERPGHTATIEFM